MHNSFFGRFGVPIGISLILLFPTLSSLGKLGDNWETKRGDKTPNLRYSAATVSSSGRIIAVGLDGILMYSDDNGVNWEFDRIKVEGSIVVGAFGEIYQVPGGPLMAVRTVLEEKTAGPLKFYTRTYLLRSNDNGNTWSMTPFPVEYATLDGDSFKFYGIHIFGLFMGPGDQLIAYGTTSGTNNPGSILWNIGGAIFRQTGSEWVQAHFGYGPVDQVANAGGRSVAISFNAVLDSADGSGWNGYLLRNAQVREDDAVFDGETLNRLRMVDIEYLDGTFVAQGGTFVPFQSSGVDSSILDSVYKYSSTAPFDGSRIWNAYKENRYLGPYVKIGENIVASSPGGAYYTSTGGNGYTLANPDVGAWSDVIAKTGGSNAFAVESSETVWKTEDSGVSWSKIWDQDLGPDIEPIGTFDGVIYARGTCTVPVFACTEASLWTSRDNGHSWQKSPTDFYPRGRIIQVEGGMIASAGDTEVGISINGGITWEKVSITEGSPDISTDLIAQTLTGRLILPVEGRAFQTMGVYYVSDDNGTSWQERLAGTRFQETSKAITVVQSGRIIVASNSSAFAGIDPRLHISDDNGESWIERADFQSMKGLDEVFGIPEKTVLEFKKLLTSTTGRILLLGEDEIITSDDNGETWDIRMNLDFNNNGPNLFYELYDAIQAGPRWFVNKFFLLTSDDDGATWGQTPFETRQANTFLRHLARGLDDRLLIFGENGSVFVSDPEKTAPTSSTPLFIREGSNDLIPIERPGLEGAIEARYSAVQRSAIAGTDYVATGGILNWGAEDSTDKMIAIETIDNSKTDEEREFLLQLVFQTENGFLGQIESSVFIKDDDGIQAGLLFEGIENLYTSETGNSVHVSFALESKPSMDVTVEITHLDETEGRISGNAFTFTPENWNQMQTLTVVGVDDSYPDGDASYELHFLLNTKDFSYSKLSATRLKIINLGDEPYQVGGEKIDPLIRELTSNVVHSSNGRTFTFRLPSALPDMIESISVISELSTDLEKWEKGSAPIIGETSGGFTSYTVTLPEFEDSIFVRLSFDVQLLSVP
jgi:photosystem II stability/assembly factor-like uncharacterized protein